MININTMFAKSPLKPLRDHIDKVNDSIAPLKKKLSTPLTEFFKSIRTSATNLTC